MTEPWTFLHVNDSHMGTPRSYRFRPAVNARWAAIKQQMAALPAEFLIHGGDLTRDGEIHEFEYLQAREDLETLPFPTFIIPGNMDVGNQHTHQNGRKRKWEDKGLGWNDPDLNMTAQRLDLFASVLRPDPLDVRLSRGAVHRIFRGGGPDSDRRTKPGCGGCSNACPSCQRRNITWR